MKVELPIDPVAIVLNGLLRAGETLLGIVASLPGWVLTLFVLAIVIRICWPRLFVEEGYRRPHRRRRRRLSWDD